MRCADQDGLSRDADPGRDGAADFLDRVAADAQRVDPDDGHSIATIVEHRGSYLAGVVQRSVVRLAIAAGRLHADLGRDVPLGEAGLEGPISRCVAASPSHHDQNAVAP